MTSNRMKQILSVVCTHGLPTMEHKVYGNKIVREISCDSCKQYGYKKPESIQVKIAREWLSQFKPVKVSLNSPESSYLKHLCESTYSGVVPFEMGLRYISSGAIIQAAKDLGLPIVPGDCGEGIRGYNGHIGISRRALNRFVQKKA